VAFSTGVKEETYTAVQAPGHVLRFGGQNTFLGEKIVSIICLKQIFLGTTKFWGHKKSVGIAPIALP